VRGACGAVMSPDLQLVLRRPAPGAPRRCRCVGHGRCRCSTLKASWCSAKEEQPAGTAHQPDTSSGSSSSQQCGAQADSPWVSLPALVVLTGLISISQVPGAGLCQDCCRDGKLSWTQLNS